MILSIIKLVMICAEPLCPVEMWTCNIYCMLQLITYRTVLRTPAVSTKDFNATSFSDDIDQSCY